MNIEEYRKLHENFLDALCLYHEDHVRFVAVPTWKKLTLQQKSIIKLRKCIKALQNGNFELRKEIGKRPYNWNHDEERQRKRQEKLKREQNGK